MDSLTITTKEIAVILSISARAVRKQAEKGKWQTQESANQKCFIISKDDKFLLGILNSSVYYFLYNRPFVP